MSYAGLIWLSSRTVCFPLSALPTPRDMTEGKWTVSNKCTRSGILPLGMGVTSETRHSLWFSLCLRRILSTEALPVPIHHANDDGFPPLCHLITSCPGFYHHFPGQSRPPPPPPPPQLLPMRSFVSSSLSPRTEPIKELTHVSTLHPFNYKQCWELNNTEQKTDLFTPGYKQDYQKQAFRSP